MYNPQVELRHVRYFVAVAEELNFTRAAQKLQIAQPPLSQQIRQLEQLLGVTLFERNNHSVVLTNTGEVFLESARHILEQVNQAVFRVQEAQKGRVGRVDIGYIRGISAVDMILPDILRVYRQRFPDVEIRLGELGIRDQLQAIQTRQLHLGFVVRPSNMPVELESRTVERIALAVVFAEQHPFAAQLSVPIWSLIDEPFIFCQRQASHDFYDRLIQLCGFSPRITQEVPDIRMQLGLVAANLGIAIVPASASHIRQQGLVYRPLADRDYSIEIDLVWRREDNSPLVQAFLICAREIIGQ